MAGLYGSKRRLGNRDKSSTNPERQFWAFFLTSIVLAVLLLVLITTVPSFYVVAAPDQDRVAGGALSPLQQSPAVTLSKLSNGPGGVPEDNPTILAGQDVTWTYEVANSGDTDLVDLVLVDDNGTPEVPGDDFDPCLSSPIPSPLVNGASHTCVFTLTGGAQAGNYTNTATVADNSGAGPVTASDTSSYFGASPAVSIVKSTNGFNANNPPGPTLAVGSTVNWSYFVQNTGNTALTQVAVTDDQGETVSCPQTNLEAGESMDCTASGTVQAGQYSNVGSVSAQPPVGPVVTDTDPSHYFGQESTGTATATATSTSTITPTITGTPPTPTATGTITPNPTITVSVSPLQARVNQSLTFTIRISNPGTAPALSAVLTNFFPTFIDVINVTFDEGVVTKTIHSVTVNLGNVMPNTTTTITILTRVNSSLNRSQTVSNVATLTYNTNLVKTASVVYSVILTTTLPGTGELPLTVAPRMVGNVQNSGWIWAGLLISTVLSGWSFGKSKHKGVVFLFGGLVLLIVSITTACSVSSSPEAQLIVLPPEPSDTATQTLMPFMPAYRFSTPEVYPTMPNYPIPSPSSLPTSGVSGGELDTSPIVRLVMPSLKVDVLVHFIPFEGHTWPVENLREDVAWLGNSSWPGLGGNTVLAGHITVKGIGDGPFRYLEELQPGDEVIVYTENAAYTYQTREQVTVQDTDLGVTLPTTKAQVTLVTCTGWDTELSIYRFRRVVIADFVSSEPVVYQGYSR